jgi:acyl-CoA synthetase (AMP-forming)/AMP-acid ligase II
MVVEGIDPSLPASYLKECPEGRQGYLVTRGSNVMKGYVQGEEATRKAVHAAAGWYVNLGDVGFWLWGVEEEGERGREGGVKDFYWVTRTSNLLIRGGTNYSYEQISQELTRFVKERYQGLGEGGREGGGGGGRGFVLAAVGLRVGSEHEDDCLVTIEVLGEGGGEEEEVERTFVKEAGGRVSKGAKPTRVRFGKVERNFKGDVNWRALEVAWKEVLKREEEEKKKEKA